MAVLILLALRQGLCRVRQRGTACSQLGSFRGQRQKLFNIIPTCSQKSAYPCFVLAAVMKEVNSWSVSSGCNHQFLSALSTILYTFPEVGCFFSSFSNQTKGVLGILEVSFCWLSGYFSKPKVLWLQVNKLSCNFVLWARCFVGHKD